jgi:hypothetical protein
LTKHIDANQVGPQSNNKIASEVPPQRYGQWLFQIAIPVSVICIAHSLVGAFRPVLLSQIEPVLAHAVAALKILGIRNISPGLDGPLNHQFYVNNNGICVWGVVLSAVFTVLAATRGNLPIRRSPSLLEAQMRTHGWTANRAWLSLKLRTLLGVALFIGFMAPLFLNGLFGWIVFQVQPKDWLITSMVTLLFFYLPGALLAPLILIMATLPLLSLDYAAQHLAAK